MGPVHFIYEIELIFLSKFFSVAMIFRIFQQCVGSVVVQVAAELCISCACSAFQHLHLRVKEDNCTKETYVNTASTSTSTLLYLALRFLVT